jgi:hypothetical protein
MPNFKRLTSTTNAAIFVNMDAVAYVSASQGLSLIHFAVADANGKLASLSVKEPLDRIAGVETPVPPIGKPATVDDAPARPPTGELRG